MSKHRVMNLNVLHERTFINNSISKSINTIYRFFLFHSRNVYLDIIKVFCLPTDAQENCFKNNIKIYIKAVPKCFGLITIIGERITKGI